MSRAFAMSFLQACLAVLVIGCPGLAQFDLNGPNAALLVGGIDPSLQPGHDMNLLVPGHTDLHIDSAAHSYAAIIGVSSMLDPTGAVVPVPWGGSIDIGAFSPLGFLTNVQLIFDGFGFTAGFFDAFARTDSAGDFDLPLVLGALLANQRVALQFIVQDVSAPPFFFDNTAAADLNFKVGQTAIAAPTDDSSTTVAFVAGNSFNFHGVNYTEISICSNGFVTFGGTTTVPFFGQANLNVAWMTDHPSIAVHCTDWDPSVNGGLGVYYEEVGNVARVIYGAPNTSPAGGIAHYSGTDINRFELRLELDDGNNPNEGQFRISQDFLSQTPPIGGAGEGLVGHTPGPALQGGAFDVNLRTTSQVGGANVAQVEEHSPDGSSFSEVGWDGAGSLRTFNDITRNWNGAIVDFNPSPKILVTGDAGYVSTNGGPTPPDLIKALRGGPVLVAGGQTLVLDGSFLGFAPVTGLGSVTLTSTVTQSVHPCIVNGVRDDAGVAGAAGIPNSDPACRDGQGLEFVSPAVSQGGNYSLEVRDENGVLIGSMVIPVVDPCRPMTILSLADDGFSPALPLTNSTPLVFMGQTRTALFLNANGYVTFNVGGTDFSESEPEFFNGFSLGTPALPRAGVALWYSDMNRGGTASGATYSLIEDLCTDQTTCLFANQNHRTVPNPAGTYSCVFDLTSPGSVDLDYSAFIPGTNAADNGIVGVTDGTSTVGTNTSLTTMGGYAANLGVYTSASAPDSICEHFAAGVMPPVSIHFVDVSGTGAGQFFIF